MKYNFHLTYLANGRMHTAEENNEHFTFSLKKEEHRLVAVLKPKTQLLVLEFYLERKYNFDDDGVFFANGFQSWTDTREFKKSDKMPGLGLVGKSLFGTMMGMRYVGDYSFVSEEKVPGSFHSHGFAYVRRGEDVDFFGSLNDRTGLTVIHADMNAGTLSFSKDLEGVYIKKPYEIMNLYFTRGTYDEVFDAYFDALGVTPRTDKTVKGYTSWYNYYQKISEDVILRDLESLAQYGDLVNTYQIDDGFETAVGDWFSIDKKKFPHGLKPMADAIHAKGFTAGLWLAPFAVQKTSVIVKEHPEWLTQFESGRYVPVGHNWGGFYALDIYNEEAREYIKSVFRTVIDEWGFDLLKLDFLYAASAVPLHNKTRGEIAYDAIDLLRECCGDVPFIACGALQLPCFGKAEYMRIGPDMSLGWAHTFLRKHMHREDVSTPNAVNNSIFRRCLNGRAFLNDSDVFLLRRTNIKFTPEQQTLLSQFIKIFGRVLFMSDNIAEYDEAQLAQFKHILTDDGTKLLAVNVTNDTAFVDYEENGYAHTLKFNIYNGDIY